MRARPIHTRGDLLDCISGRGRVTACNRSIDAGQVEVLGGFSGCDPETPTRPVGSPHWIVKVWSKFGRVWYLKVEPRGSVISVVEIDKVDWRRWSGDETGPPSIYNGDDPEKCNLERLSAVEKEECAE